MQEPRKYRKLSHQERKLIIKLANEESMKPKDIASEYGFNLSTVKAILRIYKMEGRSAKKSQKDYQYRLIQNVVILDDKNLSQCIHFKQLESSGVLCNEQLYDEHFGEEKVRKYLEGSYIQADLIQAQYCDGQFVLASVNQLKRTKNNKQKKNIYKMLQRELKRFQSERASC